MGTNGALGNSEIQTLDKLITLILKQVGDKSIEKESINLYSCWNTFHYIVKGMNSWASETVIGAETKKDLEVMVKCIELSIQTLTKLGNQLNEFSSSQKLINGTYDENTQYRQIVYSDYPSNSAVSDPFAISMFFSD